MKFFEKLIEKTKPNFEKGGKYEKWLSVYESFETFLFVPGNVTKKGSHLRDAIDLKRTMSVVVLALLPALFFGMWNTGDLYFMSIGQTASFAAKFFYGLTQVLPIIVVSYAAGLGTEFIFVYARGHEINEGYLVSGMLIPMIVPVDVPLWMVAVASIFAVIIGKEAFGGTGMNIVNPALLARAFLFFAYPAAMSGDYIWISKLKGGEGVVDGFSGATVLAQKAAGNTEVFSGMKDNVVSTWDMFMGFIPGSVGETSTLAILIGAAILLYAGVASARIMVSVFAGGYAMGLLLNLVAPETNALLNTPALDHLLLGGFAFGAVFMATDPVTAAQTGIGKIIYGFLIGVIAILIRCLNPAYPEGVMLAILFMNVFSPLIDHFVVQGNIAKRMKRAKLAVTK